MRGLKDKKVYITGAASGIGRATAQRFFEEGCQLFLFDIGDISELKASFPQRAECFQADIASPEGLSQFERVMQAEGIDVLVNNAGITRDATVGKMTMEDWDLVLRVNLTAVFQLSQIAAQAMKAQQSGVILNAASVVAHYGNFGQSNYVATKAGVIGLTKTLSKELGRSGVRVNAIAPGFIETAMVAKIPEKVMVQIKEKPPLQRLGQPEEVAAAYAFLASDDASYISGAVLNVDGGLVVG